MIQYRFPVQLDDFRQIDSQVNLREHLSLVSTEAKVTNTFRYFWRNKKYIYAYCRLCQARIRYRYREDLERYVLSYFDNCHIHNNIKKLKTETILKFIEDLPPAMDQKNIKHLVLRQFDISVSTYYYLYRKVRYPQLTYTQLMNFLEQRECYVQSQPWEEGMTTIPNIFILVSPTMKTNFLKFGQWVCFDTTYNLIKEKDSNGMKWKVGMLIGCNEFKKIVPFGMCAITNQTKDTFYKVFKAFFEIFNRLPSAIITDQSPAIKSAIQELKQDNLFEGQHLLDPFHVLKNVKKSLQNKDIIKNIVQLTKNVYPQKFELLVEKCFDAISSEKDAHTFRNFLKNSHLYCYSQIPPILVGPSVADTICQKANDLLKSKLPIERPFTVVIVKTLEFMEGLICSAESAFEIEKKQPDFFYSIEQLKYLRWLISKSIFHQLLKQIKVVIKLEIGTKTESLCTVIDEVIQFEVTLLPTETLWRCDCKYLEKSGLPCCHLLKVIVLMKLKIEPYIHERWKITQPRKLSTRFYRGRNTRRRR